MSKFSLEAPSDFSKWINETTVDFGKEIATSFEPIDQRKTAENHSRHILDCADKALANGDRDEAAHQLYRQLHFSKQTMYFRSRYDEAAQAGLNALEEGKSNTDVTWEIDKAFLRLGQFSLDGDQIPLDPKFNSTIETKYSYEAKKNCEQILGESIPFDLKEGGGREFIEDFLRRTIYLSKRYIPGQDEYEIAAKRALTSLEEGDIREVWDAVRPFKKRYEERNYYHLDYLKDSGFQFIEKR